jgi:hypothetical protein
VIPDPLTGFGDVRGEFELAFDPLFQGFMKVKPPMARIARYPAPTDPTGVRFTAADARKLVPQIDIAPHLARIEQKIREEATAGRDAILYIINPDSAGDPAQLDVAYGKISDDLVSRGFQTILRKNSGSGHTTGLHISW